MNFSETLLGLLRPPMDTIVSSMCESLEAIELLPREANVKIGDGHRSIITRADTVSQEKIASICGTIPGIKFLGEEDSENPLFVPRDNPEGILEGTWLVVDPIDGTTLFSHGLGNWSIGAGLLENGEITGGAILAPTTETGIGLISQAKAGAFLITKEGAVLLQPGARRAPKESVVLLGVDTLLYSNVTNLLPRIASNVRAVYTTGSGLWGLMMAAIGRASVIIQTPQKAWDWVPAYRALLETGKEIKFFRLTDTIVPVEQYDFESFCYKKSGRLGFVAGEPSLTNILFDLLLSQKGGWQRTSPDLVKSNW